MSTDTLKSVKLGTMPIGKLLAVMSLPAMLSMLVQSLYNVVDSIFVSQINDYAVTALSVAFPIQLFLLAFAVGIGIGTNSLISRKLGEGNFLQASLTAKNGLILSLITTSIFSVCGLLFSRYFIGLFTTNPQVIEMGTQYLTIVTVFSAGFYVEILLAKTLQATGNMIIPMVAQLIGALTNIILDPILIFGYLGFPAYGIQGAAIATITGQFFALTFTVIMFKIKSHDVNFSFKGFKPQAKIMLKILAVGIPAIFINSVASITLIILNGILKTLSEFGIPILGIYFRLQSFIFMPIFGLSQGAMPIMGYNYGAKNKARFIQTCKLTLTVALAIMIFGTIIFQVFPKELFKLFNASDDMISMGVPAMRIISLCFLPAAFAIIITTMFQSIGHGLKSLFMTITRQLAVLIPFAILLSNQIGITGIWLSYPIAEIVTVSIFLPVSLITISKLFDKNKDMPLPQIPTAKM